MRKKAFIALEDGSIFYGYSRAPERAECAEIVFNTAMTGYQEVCTDPSYANQIVVFTTSHIGNTGANLEDCESSQSWIKGVIVRQMSQSTSNWRSEVSFVDFLNGKKIPWIDGIDTRKLVRHLQKTGCQNGCLVIGELSPSAAIQQARAHRKAAGLDLSRLAMQDSVYDWPNCEPDLAQDLPLICVYDFGVKSNILKNLKKRGCRIKIVPGNYCAETLLRFQPQGIVLSNGPGDPSCSPELIENVKKLILSRIPMLGICFGCQLLGLAAGGKVIKMKFGHHGINHPVYDLSHQRVYITSQNHNFVVDREGFPESFEITHISLFDSSIQGFCSKDKSILAFQGHPEGAPGPQEIGGLFDEFFTQISSIQSLSCH